MASKSAFSRVPNRPLSYEKISDISRYRGTFNSVSDLPSDAKKGDYAHINNATYKYSNGWIKLDPEYFVNPVKKELIVDYLKHIIYLCDVDGNIIKASASAEAIITEVMDQIANDPVYLKEIQITINEETGETISLEKGLVDTIGQLKTIRNEWDSKSSVHNVTATISSTGNSWTLDSSKGAYIQTIELEDILETDYPIVDVCLSDNYNTAFNELNEYSKIYKILTYNKYIEVYANSATSIDLNIILKIDR